MGKHTQLSLVEDDTHTLPVDTLKQKLVRRSG